MRMSGVRCQHYLSGEAAAGGEAADGEGVGPNVEAVQRGGEARARP